MPCKDVTELLRLVIDDDDCLKDYRFIKRSCGQGVGADRLLEAALVGHSVDEILAIAPEEFLGMYPVDEPLEEFLSLKHLIAVQSALEVLTGAAAGGPADVCSAAEVIYESGETILETRIRVDLVTEKIESCGSCKGCGKGKKKKVRPVFA